jgi:hypothetical protein
MISTNWSNFYVNHKTAVKHTMFLVFLGILYFAVLVPLFKVHIPCVFRSVTGLYLPGCGMTRCIYALLKLDIYQAFRFNLLPFVLAPVAVIYLVTIWKNNAVWSGRTALVMLVSVIVYGVLRNVELFAWLAPTRL